MLEELREQYGAQLKRDPDKEFGPEYERTTNLERKLVDDYGFDGILLILESRRGGPYFPLGALPADCPWFHVNQLDVPAAIQTLLAPLAAELPRLIQVLRERCSHLFAEQCADSWKLHYFLDMTLYDQRRYYLIYSGGPPNSAPQPNECLQAYDWAIPADMDRLYAVHDGFGPILSSADIEVMAKVMDPICEEQKFYPEDYQYCDLLEFHPDGCGNAQCFFRHAGGITTVDWDHETWEISGAQDFFEYLNHELSEIDEE